MAIQKLLSVTAKNHLQLVALLMRGNQGLVLLLFLTFRVLWNPSREFWIATTLKLLKTLFRLWGLFFAKPKDPVVKEQGMDAIYSIPCNNCHNEYIRQTKHQFGTPLKEHQQVAYGISSPLSQVIFQYLTKKVGRFFHKKRDLAYSRGFGIRKQVQI